MPMQMELRRMAAVIAISAPTRSAYKTMGVDDPRSLFAGKGKEKLSVKDIKALDSDHQTQAERFYPTADAGARTR